jgi:hypothetical protein
MPTEIPDIDLVLEWNRTKEHLKVSVPVGGLLFNSVTGFASPVLSERQVKWITEHYEQKRRKYVFA